MNSVVQAVRWFNLACPWNQHKHSLAKWADSYVPADDHAQIHEGIQGDLRMRLDMKRQFERWIYMNTYEIVTVQLIRKLLAPGDVFIDAGANLGLLSLVASRRVGPTGKVYAFEPMPAVLERLQENIALNDVRNIELIAKGCWSAPGKSVMYEAADQHHGLSSMGKIEGLDIGRQIEIETVKIDSVVTPPVRLIKADIEGAEFEALRGAAGILNAPVRPHLILELNIKTSAAFGYHPIELVDWILDHGYRHQFHLITSKRILNINREKLVSLFDSDPKKLRNVWFEAA